MYAEIRVGKTEDFSRSENFKDKKSIFFCALTGLFIKFSFW